VSVQLALFKVPVAPCGRHSNPRCWLSVYSSCGAPLPDWECDRCGSIAPNFDPANQIYLMMLHVDQHISPVPFSSTDSAQVLHRDYETRSQAILKAVGTYKYATDASTPRTGLRVCDAELAHINAYLEVCS